MSTVNNDRGMLPRVADPIVAPRLVEEEMSDADMLSAAGSDDAPDSNADLRAEVSTANRVKYVQALSTTEEKGWRRVLRAILDFLTRHHTIETAAGFNKAFAQRDSSPADMNTLYSALQARSERLKAKNVNGWDRSFDELSFDEQRARLALLISQEQPELTEQAAVGAAEKLLSGIAKCRMIRDGAKCFKPVFSEAGSKKAAADLESLERSYEDLTREAAPEGMRVQVGTPLLDAIERAEKENGWCAAAPESDQFKAGLSGARAKLETEYGEEKAQLDRLQRELGHSKLELRRFEKRFSEFSRKHEEESGDCNPSIVNASTGLQKAEEHRNALQKAWLVRYETFRSRLIAQGVATAKELPALSGKAESFSGRALLKRMLPILKRQGSNVEKLTWNDLTQSLQKLEVAYKEEQKAKAELARVKKAAALASKKQQYELTLLSGAIKELKDWCQSAEKEITEKKIAMNPLKRIMGIERAFQERLAAQPAEVAPAPTANRRWLPFGRSPRAGVPVEARLTEVDSPLLRHVLGSAMDKMTACEAYRGLFRLEAGARPAAAPVEAVPARAPVMAVPVPRPLPRSGRLGGTPERDLVGDLMAY